MRRIYITTKDDWGYQLEIEDDGVITEIRDRGDAWTNPKEHGTGQIRGAKLRELAEFMAKSYNPDQIIWT